ncbi:MAG: processing protein [Clostridia bacterium]|nr:processing protein [Clostridia bacterium]
MEEKAYWVALSQTPGLGARRCIQLIHKLGGARTAWEKAGERDFLALGWPEALIHNFFSWRRKAQPETLLTALERKGIEVITLEAEEYPLNLKRIYDPPPVLYIKGRRDVWQAELRIAIVGTRRATPYGLKIAARLAQDLAAEGVVVVSGLARGIDTAAHEGALKGGGLTVAVLGCGLDTVYPRENKKLYSEIPAQGLLLTEFPLGTPPVAKNFPARNRIISGLAEGTVVVEAGEKSGALITADLALEQGRDVFAVPGPVTSKYSRGSHNLIKQGAKLVETAADILEEYGCQYRLFPKLLSEDAASNRFKLTPEEERVLKFIDLQPVHIDALLEAAGMDAALVNRTLIQLEIQGIIKRLPGNYYLRR